MKRSLLFISPVTPAPSGNGLAMRAFHVLESLGRSHEVTLLVVPVGWRYSRPGPELRRLCRAIRFLTVLAGRDPRPLLRLLAGKLGLASGRSRLAGPKPREFVTFSRGRLRAALRLAAGERFAVIHVFRLYLAPYGFALLRGGAGSAIQLDLDDIESATRRSFAVLLEAAGKKARAGALRCESERFLQLERRWLPRFDRVFACSAEDRDALRSMVPGLPVAVMPNVVPVPRPPAAPREAARFEFLYVAACKYFPNRDGLEFLCGRVLPLIGGGERFVIRIVGAGAPLLLRARHLCDRRIVFAGHLGRLEPAYRRATAALIPIRCGGGTRIKAIEAMAFGLPIVSTAAGVAGLGVRPGVEALVADEAGEFADQCRRLIGDAELRARLGAAAQALFLARYAPERIDAVLNGGERENAPGSWASSPR